MIKEFVVRWEKNKAAIEAEFSTHPDAYVDIVRRVVKHLSDVDADCGTPNPDWKKVHQIDDGDYQGTLVYLIPQQGYQPSTYFVVKVSYGSCSGCDTLESIKSDDRGAAPSRKQIKEYMTLALHIVQGLKEI